MLICITVHYDPNIKYHRMDQFILDYVTHLITLNQSSTTNSVTFIQG